MHLFFAELEAKLILAAHMVRARDVQSGSKGVSEPERIYPARACKTYTLLGASGGAVSDRVKR